MLVVTLATDEVADEPPPATDLHTQLQTTAIVHNDAEPEEGYATAAELTPPLPPSPSVELDILESWNVVAAFLRTHTFADGAAIKLDALDNLVRQCAQSPSEISQLLTAIQILD